MAGWDGLDDRIGEFNADDSAYQGLEDLASEEARALAHTAKSKLLSAVGAAEIIKKFKRILLYAVLGLSLFLIVFLLLYGGADYIKEALSSLEEDWITRDLGVVEDDYQTSYYDQAQFLLNQMNVGGIRIGNDMAMLSQADFKMILEYVVKYNEETKYETNPERVKYWYTQAGQKLDESRSTETTKVWAWEAPQDVYALETLSYQTLGEDMTHSTMDNDFAVPWQTITVLCEMMAENNYENFGSDADGWYSDHYEKFVLDDNYQVPLDGYFLTDSQVDGICNLVSYTYEVYNVYDFNRGAVDRDYIELTKQAIEEERAHYGASPETTWGLEFQKHEMPDATYRKMADRIQGNTGEGTGIQITDQRVPALAPYSIHNFYTVISYQYKLDEQEGAQVCTSMTVTVDAQRFMSMVQEFIPDFTFQHFFELMELLPGTQKEIEKYRNLEEIYESGQAAQEEYDLALKSGLTPSMSPEQVRAQYQRTFTTDSFPSAGIYVGPLSSHFNDPRYEYTGEGAVWIGTHGDASFDDWFRVEDGAKLPLNASDNLSKAQIRQIIEYMQETYKGYLSNYLVQDCVIDALYDWQQGQDCSVSAMLAITVQEGAYNISKNNYNASQDWNVMNIVYTEGCGFEPSSVRSKFRDYKKKYCLIDTSKMKEKEKIVEEAPYFAQALTAQFDYIASHYFTASRNQITFFAMQFSAEYNLQVPTQDAYLEAEGSLVHCYCPWWDDSAMLPSKRGWCNACAGIRTNLLAAAGLTINSEYQFPLEYYTRVSSEFGTRIHPISGELTSHAGIDIAAPEGTAIYAVADGTVTEAGYNDVAGNNCRISHSGGVLTTRYLHMKASASVSVGESVTKGQVIGYVGQTGSATGPHLHFEVKRNGVLVDPRSILVFPPENTHVQPANAESKEPYQENLKASPTVEDIEVK